MPEELWARDVKFPEDVRKIPSECIVLAGKDFYVDGEGMRYSRDEYILVHEVDPQPLWSNIMQYRRRTSSKASASDS